SLYSVIYSLSLHDALPIWGLAEQMGARPYAGNSNLLGSLDLDDRSAKIGNVNFNTFLEASFLNDFTFRTTLGGNYFNRYGTSFRSEEHTSELQSRENLVCR